MNNKLDNYKKIKRLLYWAKQTFLNEKGMEILPTEEKLNIFKEELQKIVKIVEELENDI